jgi:hypothetical protein
MGVTILTAGLACSVHEHTIGSSGGGVADCAWLASDNCWKTTIDSAAACLPPASASGTLDASGTTCTYSTGEVVTFASPLVFPVPPGRTWSFTISKNGHDCLQFAREGTSIMLTADLGTFSVSASAAGDSFRFQCPNGTSYSASQSDLSACGGDADMSTTTLPGLEYGASNQPGQRVALSLTGTSSASGTTQVFDCGQ